MKQEIQYKIMYLYIPIFVFDGLEIFINQKQLIMEKTSKYLTNNISKAN
jgi:hypothetical protein